MQVNFGSGYLTLIPPAGAADPTPIQIGILQDVQVDYSSSKKMLFGTKQFPVASADAEGKITGKAKSGQIKGALLAAALAGSTVTTVENVEVTDPSALIPTTPFQITVAGSATFVADMGVVNAATLIPLKNTPGNTGTPAAGFYVYAAGVYTFASADNVSVISVRISYIKTVAAVGKTITLANNLMGLSTTYVLELANDTATNSAKPLTVKLFAVVIPKLSLPFKNTDFTMIDIDFEALDDGSGNVMTISTAE